MLREVQRECKDSPDSHVEFDAWNSGKNITTPAKELDFVMEPFEPGSVCPDKPPSERKPKHNLAAAAFLSASKSCSMSYRWGA